MPRPGPPAPPGDPVDAIAGLAAATGLWRVHVLAWRDLDDPEAGGSELHIARLTAHWAKAGVEVGVLRRALSLRPGATMARNAILPSPARFLYIPR